MTSEVAFARTFLNALDQKPIKLQTDYAADPKTLETNGPITLPRPEKPMRKPETGSASSGAPGSSSSVTVSLKSLRNPPLSLSVPSQSLDTRILELKQRVASELGLEDTGKVRLLYQKKPCSDAKSIEEVVGEDKAGTVEFTVMVMGGVPAKAEAAPVAQGESGAEVLQSDQFWQDLRGFLEQRLRDKDVAGRAAKLFQEAWKAHG